MKVQKRKLMRIFLVPLLLVVLFQGIMPFFMLMASGVKNTTGRIPVEKFQQLRKYPLCITFLQIFPCRKSLYIHSIFPEEL